MKIRSFGFFLKYKFNFLRNIYFFYNIYIRNFRYLRNSSHLNEDIFLNNIFKIIIIKCKYLDLGCFHPNSEIIILIIYIKKWIRS
jgi:hypothetical protein